jgi:hypothetical protein
MGRAPTQGVYRFVSPGSRVDLSRRRDTRAGPILDPRARPEVQFVPIPGGNPGISSCFEEIPLGAVDLGRGRSYGA